MASVKVLCYCVFTLALALGVSAKSSAKNTANYWTAENPTKVQHAPVLYSQVNGYPSDCFEVYLSENLTSGVYRIWPKFSFQPIQVYCDMETEGGGWTVIQRRDDYSVQENFFRNWVDYKVGFGNKEKDFWLGNDAIFALTSQRKMKLRIVLEDFDNKTGYAEYSSVIVRSERERYQLVLGKYSGSIGDAMSRVHNNSYFATKDQDTNNCSAAYKGGWWYANCHNANLNGLYLRGTTDVYAVGVVWYPWKGFYYSLKKSVMMIRPAAFLEDIPKTSP